MGVESAILDGNQCIDQGFGYVLQTDQNAVFARIGIDTCDAHRVEPKPIHLGLILTNV